MTDQEKAVACLAELAGWRSDDYEAWLKVGMACKAAGAPLEAWDAWSRKSPKYQPGVCAQKWHSFNGSTGGVGVGTLIAWVREDGGQTPDARGRTPAPNAVATLQRWGRDAGGHALGWESEIRGHTADAERHTPYARRQTPEAGLVSGVRLPASVPVPGPAPDWEGEDLVRYLEALFRPEDRVSFVTEARQEEDGRWVPAGKGTFWMTRAELVDRIRRFPGDLESAIGTITAAGAWIRPNPMDGFGVGNDNVAEFRHVLVESDSMPIPEQMAAIRRLNLPCAAIVHSGGKSLHAIVRVDAGRDHQLYRQRVAALFAAISEAGLNIDKQCRNPARLSRMPGIARGVAPQYLVALGAGSPSWQAWEAARRAPEARHEPRAEIAVINAGDWLNANPPEPDQIIADTLDTGDKLVLIAPSKQRKSFFFMQMMLSLAAGRDFLAWKVVKPRNVLLVQFEVRAHHFHRRIRNMCRKMGLEAGDLDGRLRIINARGLPLEQVFASVIELAGKDTEVIGFDPFYKMHIGDENSAEDIKPLLARFDAIAETTGAAIAYVHHDPKGVASDRNIRDRGAGSNVVGRDYDVCFTLTPDAKQPDLTVVEVLLRNYAPQDLVGIRWQEGQFDVLGDEAVISTQRDASGRPVEPGADWYEADAMRAIGARVFETEELDDFLRSTFKISRQKARAIRKHLTTKSLLNVTIQKWPRTTFIGTEGALQEFTVRRSRGELSLQSAADPQKQGG